MRERQLTERPAGVLAFEHVAAAHVGVTGGQRPLVANAVTHHHFHFRANVPGTMRSRSSKAQRLAVEGAGAEIAGVVRIGQPEPVQERLDGELGGRIDLELYEPVDQILAGQLIGVAIVEVVGGQNTE